MVENELVIHNNKSMFLRLRSKSVLVFLLVLLCSVSSWVLRGVYSQKTKTITVIGQASNLVDPTKARVYYRVVAENTDRNTVLNEGESLYSNLKSNIQSSFSTVVNEKEYKIIENKNVTGTVRGYTYEKFGEFIVAADKVQATLDVIASFDALVVDVTYIADDTIKSELRNKALEDATNKADSMAGKINKKVGDVISVSEIPQYEAAKTAVVKASDSFVGYGTPRQIDTTVEISVTFSLR